MKRELLYQDNSVNPGNEEREEAQEDAQRRADVIAVLESPGYMELHRIMNELLAFATVECCSKQSSFEHIRYSQGMLDGLQSLRHRFLELSKEKKDGRQ
jgi:hypothetical protein